MTRRGFHPHSVRSEVVALLEDPTHLHHRLPRTFLQMPDVTLATTEKQLRAQSSTRNSPTANSWLLLPQPPLQNSCLSVSINATSFCPKSTTGFPWQSVIRLVSPCHSWVRSCHVLPDYRQGCTAVNSKRDSLSCATLQAHELCCRDSSHNSAHSPPQPSNSPAAIHPSLLLARPSAESAQHADSQLCSVPTVPCSLRHRPTATSCCLHRSARQAREWLSQGWDSSWPNGLVVRTSTRHPCWSSPCLCPHPSCHLCPWNPFPCFASSPSPGDQIFRTCGTSCHYAVAVRRSPSVLCSKHFRTIPTRKPSEIFSPEACSYNAKSRSYASSFASMSPEKSN